MPLAAIAALSSCEKNPGGLSGDDVITFQDPNLLKALLEIEEVELIKPGTFQIDEDGYFYFDTEIYTMDVDQNRDGQITVNEAQSVQGLMIDTYDFAPDEVLLMSEIEYFTNIETLGLYFGRMSSLDLSNNTALTYAEIGGELESINLSKNTELIYLCLETPNITSFDLSNNSELRVLDCGYLDQTSIDVSNNTKLSSLACNHNKLTSLDVSNNTELVDLGCEHNELTSLDISNNKKLTNLACDYNQLTSLDISNNTELVELSCEYNELTSLDVSNNKKLTQLYCPNNPLRSITISASQRNAEWMADVMEEYPDIEVIVK